jgi:hypothetical protein
MFYLYPITLKGLEKEFRAVKFLKAVKLSEEILNSPEFKEWFLKTEFTQLYDMKFMSKENMLDQLLTTVKFVYNVVPRPWYKRWSSVIGYSQKGEVTTYRDSYDGMNLSDLASHILHECCHVLGFSHDVKYSRQRDYSIPYQVGAYVERVATAKLKE